jgi:hypothetical protein
MIPNDATTNHYANIADDISYLFFRRAARPRLGDQGQSER